MTERNNSYPSLKQAWIIFLVFLGASAAAGIMLAAFNDMLGIRNVSIGNFFGYNLSLLFVIWFAWRYRKTGGQDSLMFNKIPGLLYPLVIVFTLTFAVFLDPLTNLIPMPEKVERIFAMLATKDLWTFFMVGITGPVLEECLFRGIILDGFLRRYRPGKAIFWSAFLFGLFHLNPWQFIPGFVIGLFLGYLYFKTRSLIPVILVHIVNNSFSYLVMYIYGEDVNSFADIIPETINYFFLVAGATVLAALTIVIMIKILNKTDLQWTFNSATNSSLSPEQAADSEEP
jgi:membrane protease YdiL (CAAX protease family)